MPFISLAGPVRKTIEKVIGGVPEDESRIICRESAQGTVYDISMVGTDRHYLLTITDDGKLLENKIKE